MDDLDNRLKSYFQQQTPDAERMADLEREIEEGARPKRATWQTLAFAAAAVLVLAFGLWWLQAQKELDPRLTSYASEIAWNHSKRLEPEYKGASYTDIGKDMLRLDFAVVEPVGDLDGLVLEGGRYCSVDDHIAAQFRLRDEQQNIWTLYQFASSDLTEAVETQEIEVDHIKVRIWTQDKVVLGLARDE